MGQSPADLNSYLYGTLVRQGLPVLNMLVQEFRHLLHDDVGGVALYLKVMDTSDIGVIGAGGESGLSLGGFQILWAIWDGLIDDFDGDDTVQDGIPSPVNSALATGGYPMIQDFESDDSLKHGC